MVFGHNCATLPVSAGEIGVNKSLDLSVPAFISSTHLTELHVDAVLQNTATPASARITLQAETQVKWMEKTGSANQPKVSEKHKQ